MTSLPAASRPARRAVASLLAIALAIPASGCADAQNNQRTILGAIGGGIVGGGACMLARGNAVGCALAGLGGAIVGAGIGHAFDERDRARRDLAVQQALYDQRLWQAPGGAATGTAGTMSAEAPPDAQQPGHGAAPSAKRAPRTAVASHAAPPRAVAWKNPDTNDSGAIIPLRTFASPATGLACKAYREDYIKDGKPYSDTMQACPKADGTGFDIKPLS